MPGIHIHMQMQGGDLVVFKTYGRHVEALVSCHIRSIYEVVIYTHMIYMQIQARGIVMPHVYTCMHTGGGLTVMSYVCYLALFVDPHIICVPPPESVYPVVTNKARCEYTCVEYFCRLSV